jgi:hypothetical protein
MSAVLEAVGDAEGKRENGQMRSRGTLALQIQQDRNIVCPHLLDAECVSLDTD